MKQKYIDPKETKKPLLNKPFLIVSAAFIIIIFVLVVIWLNPLKWLNTKGIFELKNEQKVIPTSITKDITTIYGIEMQNTCFDKFEEFIRVYGADYSKCLKTFDFTEAYCGGVDPATEKLSSVNILVILDSSGSMAETIGKDSKINIAKKAISDFLTEMPQGVNTGLVVYGNVGSNSAQSKSLSCQGIEEIVKLGKNNGANIVSAMNYFSPRGWTPLAGSIDFAKNIFL
ncbi:MAG: VWA domain-containing protein, partial [Candidatus Staskawiczbacteria bacterium]|nr:VWA domain-containing protein [Candidatus Staskawiczbacteria bacterium]